MSVQYKILYFHFSPVYWALIRKWRFPVNMTMHLHCDYKGSNFMTSSATVSFSINTALWRYYFLYCKTP